MAVSLLLQASSIFGLTVLFTLLLTLLFLLVTLVMTAAWMYAVYWTYQDASQCEVDNPELWALVVFLTSFVGLFLYILVREEEL